MENVHEMHFTVGGHECAASLTAAPAGNNRLAILILSIPSTGQFTVAEYREVQRQTLLAVQWAQSLTGTTPLIVEPWHTSGPTRRRSHEG